MTAKCIDHLNFVNETCPDCGLLVDSYGNTEARPNDYCCFPDCGCDGERPCMAGEASERAITQNVEGMYRRKDRKAVRARMELAASVMKEARAKGDT